MDSKEERQWAGPESGASWLMLILVIATVLLMMGTVALKVSQGDIKAAGNYKKSVQALYVAEAGMERAKAVVKTYTNLDSLLVKTDTVALLTLCGSDTALGFLRTAVSFGAGRYAVRVVDNSDGDGNRLNDSDGIVFIRSSGIMSDSSNRTLEAVVRKTTVAGPPGRGAVVANGNITTLGKLTIDGRDHDIDGNYTGHGEKGITTNGTINRSGNSKYGGTSGPIDYPPAKPHDPNSVQAGAGFTTITSPDDALGMDDGSLKTLAQSGAGGSQYVTDPAALTMPLSGVTYVELPSGTEWSPIALGNSSGVLVVHNSAGNAKMKNVNSGTFKGIMITDDIEHVHNDIIGMLITLTTTPSGNCVGNGNGNILYSSTSVNNALASISNQIQVISWREL